MDSHPGLSALQSPYDLQRPRSIAKGRIRLNVRNASGARGQLRVSYSIVCLLCCHRGTGRVGALISLLPLSCLVVSVEQPQLPFTSLVTVSSCTVAQGERLRRGAMTWSTGRHTSGVTRGLLPPAVGEEPRWFLSTSNTVQRELVVLKQFNLVPQLNLARAKKEKHVAGGG